MCSVDSWDRNDRRNTNQQVLVDLRLEPPLVSAAFCMLPADIRLVVGRIVWFAAYRITWGGRSARLDTQ